MEEKVYFGKSKSTGYDVYFLKPHFEINKWTFGELETRDGIHFIFDYGEYDCYKMKKELEKNFILNKNIKKCLHLFCELLIGAYHFNQVQFGYLYSFPAAYKYDSSLYDFMKNKDEGDRIKEVILPAIFEEINRICKGWIIRKKNKFLE